MFDWLDRDFCVIFMEHTCMSDRFWWMNGSFCMWWKELWRVWLRFTSSVLKHVLVVIVQLVTVLYFTHKIWNKLFRDLNSWFWVKAIEKNCIWEQTTFNPHHCVNSRSVCVSVHLQTWGMLGVPLTASGWWWCSLRSDSHRHSGAPEPSDDGRTCREQHQS